MKNTLIIIGNGFYLHHNMNTQYIDYIDYLIRSGNKDIVESFELSLKGNNNPVEVNSLWSDLEKVIALLPYEQAYIYLKSYSDENWSDPYHHDFQHEIEKRVSGIRDGIPNKFPVDCRYKLW